jgi:hypothetical protein
MRRRVAVAILPLAVVLAACGTAGSERPVAPKLPAGVQSADGSTLYSASIETQAGRTTVSAVDPVSGTRLRSSTVAGRWVIPALFGDDRSGALSGDERTLALAGPSGEGTSSFALLSTRFAGMAKKLTLRGRWSFDALSPDAKTLYLIEHGLAGHYQVRAYDVAAGRLRAGAIIEKGETDPDMTGVPVAREIDTGGSPVYTLYRRPAHGSFVHALNTREGVALCVDLPSGRTWRLAWTGSRLYAIDRVSGRRVRVDAG